MKVSRTAACLAGVLAPAAAGAQVPSPPTIECALGFQELRAAAEKLPGVQFSEAGGFEVARLSAAEKWRAEISFTTRWHPAYPAVTIRTLRRQVTGVWTADSKACGYGDQSRFAELVTDMKAGDKALTDASRDEVERRKQSRSPLAPMP
ncbi:MAG: hypothetical protein WC829_02575 [Hyphomicrobium sp.]|jgi:hypothetical protein